MDREANGRLVSPLGFYPSAKEFDSLTVHQTKVKLMKSDVVISYLIDNGKIPDHVFEITASLINEYIDVYKRLHGNGNIGSSSNQKFARKMALLNLMRHSDSKITKTLKPKTNITEKSKAGIVYCIQNPAWPQYRKIGMTKNLNSRLANYQTSDPHRAYSVVTYVTVANARDTEKDILDSLHLDLKKGEWVLVSESERIFSELQVL